MRRRTTSRSSRPLAAPARSAAAIACSWRRVWRTAAAAKDRTTSTRSARSSSGWRRARRRIKSSRRTRRAARSIALGHCAPIRRWRLTKGRAASTRRPTLPANNASLAAAAYAFVRRRIVRGEMAIGQSVSRRKVAAELGMSFLPVSEALLRLEFEGMLESRPRAGTRVRIPSRADVTGHYLVREILEAEAARRFAEHATKAERAGLMKMAAKVDALSAKKDRGPYLALHHRLHSRIAECARCEALSNVIEQTCALSSTWFCLLPRPQASPTTRRHRDLAKH